MIAHRWHRRTTRPSKQGSREGSWRPRIENLEERCLLSADAVLQWNQAVLSAIRAERPTGAFLTRDLAIVHAAIYDAVNAIDQTHTVFHVDATAPPDASPDAAAAAAGLFTASALFTTQSSLFQSTYRSILADVPDGQAKDDGIALGRFVAEQTLIWRATDGANAVVDYAPGDNPGDWRPAPPNFAPAQTPQWGQVTPFAISSAANFVPDPPPSLTSLEYTAAYNEVKDIGRVDSTTRTPEQTEIARFWEGAAGTVQLPGYINEIAEQVSQSQGLGLVDNARLFAQLDVTLADQWIALFNAKYTYSLWRPITGIRLADQTGNPDTIADPDWLPLLNTAPHPSYPSAHGSTSSAGTAALAAFFGTDDISFTVDSQDLPGVTHSFDNFSSAANEIMASVVYAGVHFPTDNVGGQQLGNSVSQYVADNFFLPVPGPGHNPVRHLTPSLSPAAALDATLGQVVRPIDAPHVVRFSETAKSPAAVADIPQRPEIFSLAHANLNNATPDDRLTAENPSDRSVDRFDILGAKSLDVLAAV